MRPVFNRLTFFRLLARFYPRAEAMQRARLAPLGLLWHATADGWDVHSVEYRSATTREGARPCWRAGAAPLP